MDMTASIAPKSDQINADDLLSGPQTFTIERVTLGNAEQPFNFHLEGLPGRPYRPSKSMRRVMVKAWGRDPELYVGHSLTLYCDPDVKFGGQVVGGIKISHMSHIEGPFKLALTATRGKKSVHVVDVLTVAAPAPSVTVEQVAAMTDVDALKALWGSASPELRAAIEARAAELKDGSDGSGA